MIFDWDENKEKRNIKDHDGITFDEASEVFFDKNAFEEFDKEHSTADETRFICIGNSSKGLLRVSFTIRFDENGNEFIRIFSARKVKKEKKICIMDKNSKNSEERILEVTQEEYDEAMAKGWTDDDISKPGKHIFRRRTRKINPCDAKIKMTMFIDGDILQHFRQRAEKSNAAPFQTQINQELREIMERDLADEKEQIDEVAEKLVNNVAFINAVSERLKAA